MYGVKFPIPQRIVTSVMGFLAIVIGLATRNCISVAITEMVVPLNNTEYENVSLKGLPAIACPASLSSVERSQQMDAVGPRYDWSQHQQGWILSSFYIGYVVTHFPGAQICERYGGKWTLAFSILFGAIFTIATPLTVEYAGFTALLVRIIYGFTSGVIFPAVSVLLAAWVPEKERTKLGTLTLSGSPIASLLSFYLSGSLLSYWQWPIVFYFWGVLSITWFILFILICYKDPANHPFISESERNYLQKEIGQLKRQTDLPATPWRRILSSGPVLAFVIAEIGQDWSNFVMVANLPKYMKEVLGYSIYDVGLYSSLPYFFMWVIALVSAFLCDYLIGKNYLTITNSRKVFTIAGGFSTVVFIVAAQFDPCNKILAVYCFILGIGLMGACYAGFRLNGLDLSPNYAGSIMALTNGIGSTTGFVAPVFVGMITPNSTLAEYQCVFWVTFGVTVVSTVVYTLFGTGKVQSWNGISK